MMNKDLSALLPDGRSFEFWEQETAWERELHVNPKDPRASDDNVNNIFYDCGEAAIVFPTRDNASEGNLFVRMQGGYLRVMYPEPECCLNLPAWREFFGFDLRGQNGWFDISLNEETGEISFSPASDTLPGKSLYVRRLNLVTDPEKIGRVPEDPDLPGEGKDPVLPGPGDFRIR